MDFSDRLNFLFEITHAEGKELAAALSITPPQISKMRNGVRGMPKNMESAYIIARFFARRCDSTLKKDALAKAMRDAHIRNIESESALTELILRWLSGSQHLDVNAAKSADDFMIRFNAVSDTRASDRTETHRILKLAGSSIVAYYGSEGKRMAAIAFLQYIIKQGKAFDINILSDESTMWILENPMYSKQLYDHMIRLTHQGCIFRRIVGPLFDMDQAFESLNRWFPLYMTGKATSYYYKRMRDNLNRMTIFVVPDVAVMFSFSVINLPPGDTVTFFTTDIKTVNSMSTVFEQYLSVCDPIMKVYSSETSAKRMHDCMLSYESCKSTCMQTNNSLSFITLPWEIAVSLESEGRTEEKNDFLNSFAQRYKKFQANLEHYDFFDIHRLADIEDVMDGMAPIPAANIISNYTQFYTPNDYLRHLKSVLYLVEHREHYYAVIRKPGDEDIAIVYVKDGLTAILTRAQTPFVIFEVSERYLVDAFTEYLRRMIPSDCMERGYRRAVAAELRSFIERLEARMAQA